MKTKYLKKLRKRYSWKWIPPVPDERIPGLEDPGYWRILDHKEKRVHEWRSAQNFISSTLGLETSVNYDHRKKDRSRLVEYKKYLNQDNI
jgi:hypothetical protein